MKKIYALTLLAFIFLNSYSQTFYQKNISLTRKPNIWSGDAPYIAKQTTDKGIIFTGAYYNNSIGDSSTFVTKLDSNFAVEWSGGVYTASAPKPTAIIQTKGLGFLIAGNATDAAGTSVFIVKLNKNGRLLWELHLRKANNTAVYSAQEDRAGNIFLSGKSDNGTKSYLWVAKLTRGGTVLIDTVYNIASNSAYANKIVSSKDNGFVVAGLAGGNSFVLKADTLGQVLWTKIIGEQLQRYNLDISEASDRDLTVAGTRNDGSSLVFQLSKDGAVKWSKSLTNTGSVTANDLLQLTTGNLLLATTVTGSPNQIDVLKLDDSTGNVLLAKNLKTTTGNIFNTFNKISETQYSLTGWDASINTNYLSIENFDSTLQNCTDILSTYTVADYSLPVADGTTSTFGGVPTITANAVGGPWANTSTVTSVCETVLPLDLLSFTLTKTDASNILAWSTAQEINTSYFEIQRSTDGRTFTAISKVTAGRKNTQNDYQFTDASPQNGTNYYRLKIVDADGRFSYSAIVWAANSNAASVVIYPIPVKDKIVMKLNSLTQNVYNVAVTDMSGRAVLRATFSVDAGTTVKEINASSLKQGAYFVKIESNEGAQVIKIVK